MRAAASLDRLETESRLPVTRWPLLGEITGRDSTSSARGHKSRTCPETHFPTAYRLLGSVSPPPSPSPSFPFSVCAYLGEYIARALPAALRDINLRASYDVWRQGIYEISDVIGARQRGLPLGELSGEET